MTDYLGRTERSTSEAASPQRLYSVCLVGGYAPAIGPSPRAAFAAFRRKVWVIALAGAELPEARRGWVVHWCMDHVAEVDPWNWHRALRKRGLR